MNFNNGILSITDHKGRYMGMQDIASCYLTGRCIDISTQGPKDNPTAVVLTVYAEEDRGKKRKNIKEITAMKADYSENATPDKFSTLLYNATGAFDINKMFTRGKVYLLYSNGLYEDITREDFLDDTVTIFE